MPDWSKLPEPQRWQIVAFLKSFRVLERLTIVHGLPLNPRARAVHAEPN